MTAVQHARASAGCASSLLLALRIGGAGGNGARTSRARRANQSRLVRALAVTR